MKIFTITLYSDAASSSVFDNEIDNESSAKCMYGGIGGSNAIPAAA